MFAAIHFDILYWETWTWPLHKTEMGGGEGCHAVGDDPAAQIISGRPRRPEWFS